MITRAQAEAMISPELRDRLHGVDATSELGACECPWHRPDLQPADSQPAAAPTKPEQIPLI